MVGRPKKKKEDSEKPSKILRKILNAMKMIFNAMKRRKNNYCHQSYPQILVAPPDFMKIQKQTIKSRKRVLNIQISSLS